METEMEKRYLDYCAKVRTRVKGYITANQLRQSYFAQECGMSESALSKLLNGNSPLTLKNIYVFAQTMGIDPSEITMEGLSPLDSEKSIPGRKKRNRTIFGEESMFVTDPGSRQFRGVFGKFFLLLSYCKQRAGRFYKRNIKPKSGQG